MWFQLLRHSGEGKTIEIVERSASGGVHTHRARGMGGGMNKENTEDFQGSETIVSDTAVVATSQYMSVKT